MFFLFIYDCVKCFKFYRLFMSPRIFRNENERYAGHLTDSSLKMTVSGRSRRSYGKIGDCEQSKSSTFFPSLSHHSSNLCFFLPSAF